MRAVIVDVHTHVFPPRMIAARAELAAADPGFAALYADPAARMASAEELLASMAEAGVDVAVAAGVAWRSAAHAEEHAAYLLDAAEHAGGRLLAFPPLAALGGADDLTSNGLRARLRELAAAGARGLGELRFDADALPPSDEAAAERTRPLIEAARAEGLALLAHCTEPVGHGYAGKGGGLAPGAVWRLLAAETSSGEAHEHEPTAPLLAAHWGGGLALYAAMPEVRALFEAGVLGVDTAATRYLYDPRIVEAALTLGVGGAVLWGSDFPLRSQVEDRRELERATADPEALAAILGGNAVRLLGL
jgi:uncharacterized protein